MPVNVCLLQKVRGTLLKYKDSWTSEEQFTLHFLYKQLVLHPQITLS